MTIPKTCGDCQHRAAYGRCVHEWRGPLREVDEDEAPPRLCPLRDDVHALRTAEHNLSWLRGERMLANDQMQRALKRLGEADRRVGEAEARVAALALPVVP